MPLEPYDSLADREKMKEEFKKELQFRQQLLQQVQQKKQLDAVNRALHEMENMMNSLSDADDIIEQLDAATALAKAKIEMGLEQVADTTVELSDNANHTEKNVSKTLGDEEVFHPKTNAIKADTNTPRKSLGDIEI
jgi:Mg2+ and Co2+ transporter CorA